VAADHPDGGLSAAEAAVRVIGLLVAGGLTIGTAESLTGGLVAAELTAVPGASAVVRGGIVAYAAQVKQALLGVPGALLDRVGTVHEDVALAMARGVAGRLPASVGVATTGVAGPDPVDAHPVGTVHLAVVWPGRPAPGSLAPVPASVRHAALRLTGDRAQIRRETVRQALNLLVTALSEDNA
jgi:nicotinamide-nucleotide amidase